MGERVNNIISFNQGNGYLEEQRLGFNAVNLEKLFLSILLFPYFIAIYLYSNMDIYRVSQLIGYSSNGFNMDLCMGIC